MPYKKMRASFSFPCALLSLSWIEFDFVSSSINVLGWRLFWRSDDLSVLEVDIEMKEDGASRHPA